MNVVIMARVINDVASVRDADDAVARADGGAMARAGGRGATRAYSRASLRVGARVGAGVDDGGGVKGVKKCIRRRR